MIYDDYINYCDQYRVVYGERTTVLIQVGDFFELYGVQNETETLGADMYTVGDICNLIVTRKNKSILDNSRQNPLMAGFPLYALPKHSQALLDHGYTVIIIRQVTPPPNVRREVTEILSPSMNITPSSTDSNYLITYFWDASAVGIAGVDVSTGESFVYEVVATITSNNSENSFMYDEAFRIMQAYQPKEVVLVSSGSLKEGQKQHIDSLMNTGSNNRIFHKKWGTDYKPEVRKVAYQNEVVNKVYRNNNDAYIIGFFERVGIERQECARNAFVHMLLFAFEHNELIVRKLRVPRVLHNETFMTIEYNSAVQLNLLGCFPGDKPLIHLLNKCCTAFGSRLFRNRMLSPCISADDISERYARIDHFIETKSFHLIRKTLKHISDIERQFRKMELQTLSPIELYALHTSLSHAKVVATHDQNDHMYTTICDVIAAYDHILLLDDCAKFTMNDIKSTIFVKGYCHEIDTNMEEMNASFQYIEKIARDITALDTGDACLCRMECNERDGYFLQTTKKRWDTARARGQGGREISFNDFIVKPISGGSNILRITNQSIEKASDKIINVQHKVTTLVQEKYKEFLSTLSTKYSEHFQKIISYIADVDVATNNAHIACEFGYCKPTIERDTTSSSFIEVCDIRHPLIEQLSTQTQYVGNDVRLDASGMLLYGINASGKSSLMKAIGLCIIMAQSGMYVPATSMRFSPYKHIFTRITSMDNLYRGMSTFVVEMAELRNILVRADANSLVIGDELCAGTESTSAVAIVAAGVQSLLSKNVSFIFATHLHELCDLSHIASNNNLCVFHMHISTDDKSGKIIYDRKLRPGSGSDVYGLEVCQSLGMPVDFMKTAFSIRRSMTTDNEMVRNKWSRYNRNVCVDMCRVCQNNMATEVHHINYQHTSMDDTFAKPGVKINHAANLVPLCNECHMKEHHGSLQIFGYRDTSRGSELHFTDKENIPNAPKLDCHNIVATLRKKYKYEMPQWYLLTIAGKWRKCKLESIIKEARKSYKYELSEEDVEYLKTRCC